MATTNRQTSIFGVEDWKRIYQTYSNADFQSYDFETLRKVFVDYLRSNYPETFNDYVESSEYIALLDLMAFMGQALAFRGDLNARENFIDTAERRDSVIKLATLVNYTPKRNIAASGYLKISSVTTTENVFDYQNINLAGTTINWNDVTNPNWYEQFITVVNAALVNSQRFGRSGGTAVINGVTTDEYSINLRPGFLPVASYDTDVDGQAMNFEVVSATTRGKNYVYEVAPRPDLPFNILYRNDLQGYDSVNTGFFFYFKQGILTFSDFTLDERINNWQQPIDIEGINNEDVWLYQLDAANNIRRAWTQVQSVYTNRDFQNNQATNTYYSITSRTNDQITLNFGDGVFAEAPVGSFRTYVRQSNGLTYTINPEEMESVFINLVYISKEGKPETLTLVGNLEENVTNSQARESLSDIKLRAPSRFYSQDRMVNGEDYNNFPFTQFNSIIKSKGVARSVIGTARNLDLIDPTGKYSSTNAFGDDGALYEEKASTQFRFSFNDVIDINSVIVNRVQPLVRSRGMLQYYYAETKVGTPLLSRKSLDILGQPATYWSQISASTNQCTGYFSDADGRPVAVGDYAGGSSATGNRQFIRQGALVKFQAPPGYVFDINNRLQQRAPIRAGDKLTIWAPVNSVVRDGRGLEGTGTLDDGNGAVALGLFVPGDGKAAASARVLEIIPVFINTFGSDLVSVMVQFILIGRNFGIAFNNTTQTWKAVYPSEADYEDAWLVKFIYNDDANYTVISRSLNYIFASVNQCRFFYDSSAKIFDVKTGKVIDDYIKVLGTNSDPNADPTSPLQILLQDLYLDITGQTIEPDGFVNDFSVLVGFPDSDSDDQADNPDVFYDVAGNEPGFVFLKRTIDPDNIERYSVIDSSTINAAYANKPEIQQVIEAYPVNQIFYASNDRTLPGTVNSIGRDTNVSRVIMSQPHGLSTNDLVIVTVDSDPTFDSNGPTAVTYIDATTFSYENYAVDRTVTRPDLTATIVQPASFFKILETQQREKYLEIDTDYQRRLGRGNIYFQYRHNSPNTRRINPGITNIIDLYVVTNDYYNKYVAWIQDTTNSLIEPDRPTIGQLAVEYQALDEYKMLTDNMILNSVTFKPLFGSKAAANLRATFKVVKNASVTTSDREVKSSLVSALNNYFSIDNWDFGQTFYFSELSSYLHQVLGDIISSVVIVPDNTNLGFGNLYEIQSGPTEIFVNAATVVDVEIVAALTPSNLRIQTQG